MAAFVGALNLSRLERVICGHGTVGALGNELERRGCSRAVVVTGRTLAASALLDRVTGAMSGRCVSVFPHSRQHVPSCSVRDLARTMVDLEADALVSFGGGSPIDTAKAAIHSVLAGEEPPGGVGGRGFVHIAVPTTLSAGEFTDIAGVTDEATRVKRAIVDPRLAPCTVVADPGLTLETPDWLWVASGIRALDHAVESAYSVRHHPLGDALSAGAIALLLEHLPASIRTAGAEQLEHRSHCQMAAWMSVFGLPNAGFGLSHALGHQIGPRWDVPHGVTSCVTLPHVMRFMAARAPGRFRPIAEGLGIPFDAARPRAAAEACAGRVEALIAQLNLPQRLSDTRIPRHQLAEIVDTVHVAMHHAGTLDRDVTPDELLALLERAY